MDVKYVGVLLMSLWLIAQGLEGLFEFYFPFEKWVLPLMNLAAGLALLFYAIKLKRGDIGLFLLGCWATLNSGLFLFHYSFEYSNTIIHVLGLVAGALLIMGW